MQPTGKRYCIAVDIAGTSSAARMVGQVTTLMSSMAAAMVTSLVKTEPKVTLFVFHNSVIQPVRVVRNMSVGEISELLMPVSASCPCCFSLMLSFVLSFSLIL